jgi:tetratricopeptide (TPR) repeat protein
MQSSSELAQTWYVRGIISMKQGRFANALVDARCARTVFQLLGDARRDAYTRLLEGGVAFEQGDAHQARDLFRSTLPALRRAEEETTLALAWMNLGSAEARLGNLADAEDWIRQAEAVFKHRGVPEELARAHWAYGYALATHANVQTGMIVMRQAAQEFDELRLPVDAAFVRLDLTEALLANDDRRAAIATCKGIADVLNRAGATAAARQAVKFLCRALSQGQATVSLARYVKTYALASQRGTVAPFEPRVAA